MVGCLFVFVVVLLFRWEKSLAPGTLFAVGLLKYLAVMENDLN